MPIYLVGSSFWQPIVDGLEKTLQGEFDGQYIKYKDLSIMTVIGTTHTAMSEVMQRIGGL